MTQAISRTEFERATAQAIERLPVPFLVLAPCGTATDAPFQVVWANESACEVAGHAPEGPWPSIDRVLGHVPDLEDDLGRAHRDREVVVRIRPVDRDDRIDHLRLVIVPLEQSVAMFVQDVSREAGVQADLDVAQSALERVQRWGQMGVWEADLGTGAQYWSSQVFAILDVDEASLRAFRSAVHPDDLGLVDHVLHRAEQQPGPYKFNHRVVRGNEVGSVSQHLQSVPGADGRPARLLGAVIDVTATEAIERQLHRSQGVRGIGLLAGGLAHDFNNALVVLLGHIDVLSRHESMAEHPELSMSVDAMKRATTRASGLTRKLMSLGQDGESQTEVLLAAEVVQSTAKLVSPALGSDVTVIVEADVEPHDADGPAREPVAIAADATHVEQVLLDLVLNARDAGSSTIALRVDRVRVGAGDGLQLAWGLAPGAYGVLSVVDDGSGMDDETLRRIFDPFFTTKGAEHGSGVGLTNADRFASRAGGALVVTSAVGAGTTMSLHLPLVESEDHTDAPAHPPARRGRKPTRVVVSVDDPDRSRQLVDVLTHGGHQVVATTSTAEMSWTVSTEPIDLVVVDAGRVDRVAERTLDPDRTLVLGGPASGALADAAFIDDGTATAAVSELVDDLIAPTP